MFNQRRTTGSAIVERTTARSLSRILRRATTPSVSGSGGLMPPTYYSLRVPSRSRSRRGRRAAGASAVAVAAGALLAGLARRGVLRPLDELLRGDHRLTLVLLHELEPD